MSRSTATHPTTANVRLLRDGVELLRGLSDEDYGEPTPLARGTVGEQFRHVGDFYACFLRDLASGRIDYDRRMRDDSVRRDRRRAVERLSGLADTLEQTDTGPEECVVDVCSDGPDRSPEQLWVRSTVGRELQFLLSHTVHHYALVGILLRARGLSPPPEFGVAPSTLRHARGR